MISYKKKFVFVHIYKVAGTSVRSALSPYVDNRNISQKAINRIVRSLTSRHPFPYSEQPLHDHAKAKEYEAFLGDAFRDFYSFAFVRNPYDWQISLYEYARQTPHHHQHEQYQNMKFDEYIHWRCSEEYTLQKDFICDQGGTCIVNYVGRLENLYSDFDRVVSDIGINAALPHLNKSKRSIVREYYSDRTQQLVADTFDEDFQMFGYDKALPG